MKQLPNPDKIHVLPFEDSFQGRAEERILRHLYWWAPLNAECIAYDLSMPLIDVKLCLSSMRNKKWTDGNNLEGYEISFRFGWMDDLVNELPERE